MRRRKPEEIAREWEEAGALRRKSGLPSYIPPSPHSGPLNPESLGGTLSPPADIRTRHQWPNATPLHWAALKRESPEAVEALLAAGADVNARDTWGLTPADITEYNETWRGARAWRRPWADEADEED